MALKQEIEQGIKQAMLSKDQDRLRTLRAIKSAILLAETESSSSRNLGEADEIKILTKAAKQRRDSLEVYREQGRDDLADKEEKELVIIEEFLPRQLNDEELTERLQSIISDIGASGPQDMGKVMGVATKQLAGQADGKVISGVVRKLLS